MPLPSLASVLSPLLSQRPPDVAWSARDSLSTEDGCVALTWHEWHAEVHLERGAWYRVQLSPDFPGVTPVSACACYFVHGRDTFPLASSGFRGTGEPCVEFLTHTPDHVYAFVDALRQAVEGCARLSRKRPRSPADAGGDPRWDVI